MSKWAERLKEHGVNLSLCDNGDKTDKSPPVDSQNAPFVTSVPFVTREQDFQDAYEERAAIIEHDGKLPRVHAETAALEDTKIVWLERARRQA